MERKEHKDRNFWSFFFALHSGSFTQFRKDFTTDDGRIFNAKPQSREGAKFFSLGASAPLRLCVERPWLYPRNLWTSAAQFFWSRLSVLGLLRLRILRSTKAIPLETSRNQIWLVHRVLFG